MSPLSRRPRHDPAATNPSHASPTASGERSVAAGGDIGQAITGEGAVGIQSSGPVFVADTVQIEFHTDSQTAADGPPRVLLGPDGQVPRVGEIGLHELGIHPAAEPEGSDPDSGPLDRLPVYVPRDCDEQIQRALANGGLVIVEGRSAAGKSRAAAEAMQRVARGRALLVPQDRAALLALAEPPGALRDAVIWLDDLERYWSKEGLDAHHLNRLSPPGRTDVVVLATLRSEARRHMETSTSSTRSLLRVAKIVRPEFKPSPAERARAEERRSDPRIAQWLDRGGETGLAEYLAAGPAAVDRWQSGRDGDQLVGAALVSVAVDCRRAGYRRPVPLALLSELHRHYLEARDVHRSNLADLDQSLEWATTPVGGASSCLLPYADSRYGAFDYLVDHVERDQAAAHIPEAVWLALLDHATGDDLTAVIVAAQNDAIRTNRPAVMDSALARHSQVAGFNRICKQVYMLLFITSSDREGWELTSRVERWLRPFVDAGNPLAMATFGSHLYLTAGRPEEGETWIRRAAAAGYDSAASDLAHLLYESNRLAELDDWLAEAVADGRGLVITYFAGWLIGEGKREEGERRLRRAADAGCVPAITTLASLAEERGDETEAKAWYDRAVALGDPAANVNLGVRYAKSNEGDRAEGLFRAAAEANYALGMHNLGVLLRPLVGRRQEAEGWFRRAGELGHRPAAVEVAHMMYERRDSAGLTEWLEGVREGDGGGETVRDFANRLAAQGDLDGAERWYRRALDLGQLDAMTGLGCVLDQRGDAEGAMTWWRRAAERGEILAQLNLGVRLMESGAVEEAERWLMDVATRSLHGETSTESAANFQVRAMFGLGVLLFRQGRHDEAREWFQQAAEKGDLDAMYNLARLHLDQGRLADAKDWFRRAAERGDADAARALRSL